MTDRPRQDVSAEPRRRPGGRTKETTERITSATLELLMDGGIDAVTFAAVADRAGVARATMYRRWSSPADLVVVAVRRAAADAIRIPDHGDLRADLVEVLRQIATFISSPVGRAVLAAGLVAAPGQSGGDEVGSSADATVDSWAERWADVRPVFDRAIARGELDRRVDADAVFGAVAGGIYFRVLVMGRPVDDAWIERVVAAVVTPLP